MAFQPSSSSPQNSIVKNPNEEEAIRALWQSQVLIPFASGSDSCAFLGPFTLKKDLKFLETFFPRHPDHPILAFKEPIDTSFLREVVHSNRAMPVETGLIFPNYRAWFTRLQPTKSTFWKSVGIYNLIEANTKP
ncbi:hypothetical protein A2U01_0001470 [Trifolium medium]|uniref:Uncharacterized protein n=1 Tax=Trifolium medium TaxID=97028 RepID=A0A392M123_9FABA|nr:hypothetical protein [Trifolium medium]